MTDQDQIRAIAELDGWTDVEVQDYRLNELRGIHPKNTGKSYALLNVIPNYLTSRDAIVPVIEKQELLIKSYTLDILGNMVYHKHKNTCLGVLFATPRQLCEALLRAVSKWIDTPTKPITK